MKPFFSHLGLMLLVFNLNSNVYATSLLDTTKVYEDDKIYIYDYGKGNIDLKFKNETNPKSLKLNYQIRLFYDDPIFLGSKKIEFIENKGIENVTSYFMKMAIKYQEEHFINDLELEPSQFKIITKTVDKTVKFYYLRAHSIRECINGELRYFWCSSQVKNRQYVELNINDKEIYFKNFIVE